MFKTLDAMYKKSLSEEITPCNIPKICVEKYTDVKEYKRQYYLKNIETYRQRNEKYRQRNYKESTLDWMLEQEILNGDE